MTETCKTCTHLDVPLDKAGRRVVRKNNAYRCQCPLPDMPPLPIAITSAHNYREPSTFGRHMSGDDGAGCPTWKGLTK